MAIRHVEREITTAVICPGQGGQELNMGKGLAQVYRPAYEVWEMTNAAHRSSLGYDITDLVWDKKINGMEVSDAEAKAELQKTPITQAVVFADSIANWLAAKEVGAIPKEGVVCTGLSLGRVTAAVAAGAIGIEGGVNLVKARGWAFNIVPGFLAAFIDTDTEITDTLMRVHKQKVGDSWIYLAMRNSPLQIVAGAKEEARADTITWLNEQGLEEKSDYVWVPVSGPFHTPDMEPSRESYARALRKTKIEEPEETLHGNGGVRLQTPDELYRDLLDQTTEFQDFCGNSFTLIQGNASHMIFLSNKRTEANLVIQAAKSVSRSGIPTPIVHQFSSGESVPIGYQVKIA